jgi:microcystin-dependent protein
MVDTPTTTYGLLKPQVGASSDTWGTTINADLDAIDSIVAGVAASVTSLSASTSPFLVPTGAILLWSGSVASIPSGWLLCDGTSGTPNLKDRFVVGAGNAYAVDATGGADTVTLSAANMPAHTHGFSTTTSGAGAHTHDLKVGDGYQGGGVYLDQGAENGGYYSSAFTAGVGDHTHTVSGTTASSGSGTAHENRPPYYALAYIMKS